MAWHDEHVFAVTSVVTRVPSGPPDPPWTASRARHGGAAGGLEGPRAAAVEGGPTAPGGEARDDEGDPAADLPPGLVAGQPRRVASVEALDKKTRPPRRFTDATLLTAMERAGAASTTASCLSP